MYHLAQVNIARVRFPLDDPRMHGFVSRLAEIGGLADNSPGFVWRVKDEIDGSADYIQAFGDQVVFNMTVWTGLEALRDFTYLSLHRELFQDRAQWFEPMTTPHLAMWWIAAGTIPTVSDAQVRLESLRVNGETPFAFTFRNAFPAPAAEARSQGV